MILLSDLSRMSTFELTWALRDRMHNENYSYDDYVQMYAIVDELNDRAMKAELKLKASLESGKVPAQRCGAV